MVDIIELLIFIAVLSIIISFTVFVAKRVLLLIRVYQLVGMCNAKITLHTFPFRPMWAVSEKPDISVRILDTVYLLRIYSGGGIASSVHFVNEKFSVVYTQVKGGMRTSRAKTGTPSLTGGVNIGTKVRILPEMKLPKEYEDSRLTVEKILLLNPAPGDLTFVTEEKTSIRVAFTGDEMYGMKVFTASTFMRYADRESRKPRVEKPTEFDYYYYNGSN